MSVLALAAALVLIRGGRAQTERVGAAEVPVPGA
jgi:hypothetical protein